MPTERYGFSEDEWQSLKELISGILVARVRSDNVTIAYSELTQMAVSQLRNRQALSVKTREILTPTSYALAAMLGEISNDSCNVSPDHGMLSVIVVHKHGDLRPGKGFFEYAEELGRLPRAASDDEKEELWVRELSLVQRSYRT
jgi:hypothetical protein